METITKYLELDAVTIGLLVGIVILMLAGFVVLQITKSGNSGKQKRDALFRGLYHEFQKTPLIKNYVQRMSKKLATLSVYTKDEVKILVSQYFSLTAAIITITTAAAMVLFDDAVSVIICIILAYMLPNAWIDKRMAKINYIVYTQLKYAIESIRLEYMRCYDVTEALETASYGNRIAKIMDAMHYVLISTNGELRLKEFFEMTPFKPIQTLAQICFRINNTGDEFDRDGNSAFVESLLIMSQDINQELERQNYQYMKFGNLEYLALVTIPAIPIVEWFLLQYMPGTALIIKGLMGYLIRIGILSATVIVYGVIANANSLNLVKDDDRILFITRLLSYETIYRFIRNISPKNRKRRLWKQKLNNAFSKKTIEAVFLEKIGISTIVFLLALLMFASAIFMGRGFMLKNTDSLSFIQEEEDWDTDKETILAMDNRYIALRKGGYVFEEEELTAMIRETFPNINDLKLAEQQKRLEKKYEWLEGMYFRWYYIPISFWAGVLAFWIPDFQIRRRMSFLEQEEEEEFLQIQTIMTILMSMNCDTLDALEYLTQLAHIHKDMLLYCYHGYAANPVKELGHLVEKTPIPDFKRFIGKLKMTVDELSLSEAFIDLKMDREHIAKERDAKLRDNIDARRRKCGQISKVPIMMTMILLFVFPLMYMGFTEMMSGISAMQKM